MLTEHFVFLKDYVLTVSKLKRYLCRCCIITCEIAQVRNQFVCQKKIIFPSFKQEATLKHFSQYNPRSLYPTKSFFFCETSLITKLTTFPGFLIYHPMNIILVI